MEELCSNCKCWKRDGADGICKAHAPFPSIAPVFPDMKFQLVEPRRNFDDYCIKDFTPIEEVKS